MPWHNQELYQSNSYTKCYGIYKTVQHNGEFFSSFVCVMHVHPQCLKSSDLNTFLLKPYFAGKSSTVTSTDI